MATTSTWEEHKEHMGELRWKIYHCTVILDAAGGHKDVKRVEVHETETAEDALSYVRAQDDLDNELIHYGIEIGSWEELDVDAEPLDAVWTDPEPYAYIDNSAEPTWEIFTDIEDFTELDLDVTVQDLLEGA